MAALRAKTIHKITCINNLGENVPICKVLFDEKSRANNPIKKPIIAKGKAKIVCENFTKLAYFLTKFIQKIFKKNKIINFYFKEVMESFRSLTNSHMTTPAAVDTFKECFMPN